jgi:hypothetical protein
MGCSNRRFFPRAVVADDGTHDRRHMEIADTERSAAMVQNENFVRNLEKVVEDLPLLITIFLVTMLPGTTQ